MTDDKAVRKVIIEYSDGSKDEYMRGCLIGLGEQEEGGVAIDANWFNVAEEEMVVISTLMYEQAKTLDCFDEMDIQPEDIITEDDEIGRNRFN